MTALAFLAGAALGWLLTRHHYRRELGNYKAKSRRVLAQCRAQFLGD